MTGLVLAASTKVLSRVATDGNRLFVSRNTVSSEVGSIYRKLGVSSRHDAVQRATAVGLLGG
jgi:ATP/maltotriose-dependent transcriptional regulator MalT